MRIRRQASSEDALLDGANNYAVHHLKRRGLESGCDDSGDGAAAVVDIREVCQQRADGGRKRRQMKRRFRRDTKRSFRAGEDTEQVVAGRSRAAGEKVNRLASGEDDACRRDVVDRHAVFQAVYAARVLSDVAADGTSHLARRVWHVMKIEGRGGARELRVDESGLNDCSAILRIKPKQAAHPRQLDHHAFGQRAAGEARACAARSKRDALAPEHAQHFRHLFGAFGEDDGARASLVLRQPVTLVNEQFFGVSQYGVAAYNRAQVLR